MPIVTTDIVEKTSIEIFKQYVKKSKMANQKTNNRCAVQEHT